MMLLPIFLLGLITVSFSLNSQTPRFSSFSCTCSVNHDLSSLEAKVQTLFGLVNKTSGLSDAVESLEGKAENVSDAVRFLEAKVESLIGSVNRSFSLISRLVPEPSDRWLKLNLSPVCFGARGDQFGNFTAPAGRLAAIKLVWRYGYVSCDTRGKSFWSYWGCNDNPVTGPRVNVVITNLNNHILLPPNQFIHDVTNHQTWYTIPGYNSLSPELVLSVFLNPISFSSNQVLRLWYGEDLVKQHMQDNGGRVCADVYSIYD